MILVDSDLHNESDPVRSTRAETRQELRLAKRYGREPFRNCFRFAWGHNSIQLRGNVSFPRESRGMIYIRVRWPPENLSSILLFLSKLYSNLAASSTTVMSDVVAVEQSFLSFIPVRA